MFWIHIEIYISCGGDVFVSERAGRLPKVKGEVGERRPEEIRTA